MRLLGRPVLILEDDREVAESISDVLKREGFTVCAAANADEARAVVARIKIGALLADIMLPGESGLLFAKELRGDPANDDVVLIFMSGVDEAFGGVALAVQTLRAAGYIRKPFTTASLVEMLAKTMPEKP